MRRTLQTISWLAIVGTILPSFLYLLDLVSLSAVKWTMLVATVVWFAVTPWWMGRSHQDAGETTDAPGTG